MLQPPSKDWYPVIDLFVGAERFVWHVRKLMRWMSVREIGGVHFNNSTENPAYSKIFKSLGLHVWSIHHLLVLTLFEYRDILVEIHVYDWHEDEAVEVAFRMRSGLPRTVREVVERMQR